MFGTTEIFRGTSGVVVKVQVISDNNIDENCIMIIDTPESFLLRVHEPASSICTN